MRVSMRGRGGWTALVISTSTVVCEGSGWATSFPTLCVAGFCHLRHSVTVYVEISHCGFNLISQMTNIVPFFFFFAKDILNLKTLFNKS